MDDVDVEALRAAIGRVRETMRRDQLAGREQDIVGLQSAAYRMVDDVYVLLPLLDGLPDRLAALERAAETGQAWRDQPEFGNVDHLFNAWAAALEAAGYGEAGEDGDG